MKKNYSGVWKGFAIVFVAVIYSIILFALKKDFSLSSWLAYGYTLIAFFILLMGVCFQSGKGKAYPMFDLVSAGMACVYFCVVFILGGIAAMILPDLRPVTVALTGLILLMVYVVAVLLFRAGTSTVQGLDETDGQRVVNLRFLAAEIDAINAFVPEEPLKEKLRDLRDSLRYSDPMGQAEIAELEERIKRNISLLREEAEEGETERVSERIDKLQRLLTERNSKCRALKK